VLGEVQKPGIYPFRGSNRLFELISAAGGTTALAGNKVTITHREQPQQPETVTLTFGEQGARQSNVTVAPGDTVIFEKAGVVYVVGAVRKPTGIAMSNPDLTVLQALAMAEGADRLAALGKAKLIRKTAQGPKEIPLPLNKMLSAQIPDVQVQPDDIIFVPSSAAKAVARRTMDAAITAATALAIYRP
jgi:polysaccharide export outer membrane protein